MASKVPDKPWKHPRAAKPILLRNGRVIDVTTGAIESKDILIADGYIKRITECGKQQSNSEEIGTEAQVDVVVDLKGAYVSPGLIDCHVHLSVVPGFADLSRLRDISPAQSLLRQPYLCGQILARGFTSVRDCGGATLALKEAVADGVFPGPRVFFAGRALSQTGGHADLRGANEEKVFSADQCGCHQNIFGQVCDGVPACLEAARDQLRRGADFIKIMAGGGVMSPTDKLDNLQFTGEEIRAIVAVARAGGTYVTAHAYTPAAIRHCVDNGVRGIEHGNLIDSDTARLMADRGVYLTPTLVTYKMMASLAGGQAMPPESAEKNQRVLRAGVHSLRIADEAGVTVCHGSDLLGSLWAAQTHEFAIRAQALAPLKVLQGATVNAARMLMAEESLGQVEEGYLADLLILGKNPLEDITILDNPDKELHAVIKNGEVVKADETKLHDLAKMVVTVDAKL